MLLEAFVRDSGSAEAQDFEFGEFGEGFETGVGDLGVVEVEFLEVLEGAQVFEGVVGDVGVGHLEDGGLGDGADGGAVLVGLAIPAGERDVEFAVDGLLERAEVDEERAGGIGGERGGDEEAADQQQDGGNWNLGGVFDAEGHDRGRKDEDAEAPATFDPERSEERTQVAEDAEREAREHEVEGVAFEVLHGLETEDTRYRVDWFYHAARTKDDSLF